MFTNEEKILFLACDNFFKFQNLLTDYDINKFDNFGNTILHYYLKNIKSFQLESREVIQEMVKRGIDINAQSATGTFRHTPLNIAIQQKLRDIFDLLIELGANVNATVANGNSLLSTAIMQYKVGDEYFIEKLIENGANVYQKNDYGHSPIGLAYTISNFDLRKYFNKFEYNKSE
jgi:ankyrin repeat protein